MIDPAAEKKTLRKLDWQELKEKLRILKQVFTYNTINQGIATGTK